MVPDAVVKPASRIAFLDYLRVFAFASVLIGHELYGYVLAFSNDPAVHATPRMLAKIVLPLLNSGGAGVVVFFLVSGYIITHVLQTERTGEFLIKRIFRIYPLYIVAVLIEHSFLLASGRAPKFSVLLLQLTLMGDLFGTPYSLHNVEWTLRLEVLFYLAMAFASLLSITTARRQYLPYYLLVLTLACAFLAPIPSFEIWSRGYLTIYGPFLLLGSIFYLYEKSEVGTPFVLLFTTLVFCQYFTLIATYQGAWLNDHFAMLAFLIFLGCFFCRKWITATPFVLVSSDLTYSVYLFHHWLYDAVRKIFSRIGITVLNPEIQALLVLLLVCFLMMRLIEKNGIKLGRLVLARVKSCNYSPK